MKIKNIGKYIGIGITSGLTLLNITTAQTNLSEYKKPLTEIVQKEDNITIPEKKYNEYIKNYKTEKNNTLNKITDITLDGYISSALSNAPLNGINVMFEQWDGTGPIDTLETMTNSQGYYSFMITGINDQKEVKNIGQIEYFNGKARITVNNYKKIKLTTYDILGQKIEVLTDKEIQGTETIDLKLPIGQTLTKIEIDGKKYTNIHINNGKNFFTRKEKNIEQITEETIKKLEKTQYITGLIYITDQTNQNHGYSTGTGEMNNNTTFDMTLIPRIQLENTITDPEYTTIDTIKTLRDLKWYARRVYGDWDNKGDAPILWPIKLHIDTTNAPAGWKEEIRNVIQYYQDSLDIHPDSLIKENPTYIEPSFSNGFSAINIIYTDSTVLGQAYSSIEIWYSSSHNTIVGGKIYVNTPRITNTIDVGTTIARQIEKYTTQTIDRIKDPRYLGNSTNFELGTVTRPNNDEKKLIKIGRFSNKPIYINRIYP